MANIPYPSKTLEPGDYLKAHGFYPLTAEADTMSFRILVDITSPEAIQWLASFLGMGVMESETPMDRNELPRFYGHALQFKSPWNQDAGQLASCMLSYDMLYHDLFLFIARQEFEVVYRVLPNKDVQSNWQGSTREWWDSRAEFRKDSTWEWEVHFGVQPGHTRNRHEWSGRIE